MTHNGTHLLVGSSSGVYYIFNKYGEVVRRDDLGIEITSVDISENNIILGTKTATLILDFSGKKRSHFTSEPVLSVAISEDDSCAISGTRENVYIFSSLESASELNVGTPVNYVSISYDGEKAAAATADKIYFFEGNALSFTEYEISSATSLHFLSDGSLAVGTEDGFFYRIREAVEQIGELESIIAIESSDDMIAAGTSSKIYVYSSGTEKTITMDNLIDCDISSNGFIAAADPQYVYLLHDGILWQKDIENCRSVELSSDGSTMAVTTDTGIFFYREDTTFGTRLFPYPSRGHYSFEEFQRVWTYSVSHIVTPYLKQRTNRVAVGDVTRDGVNEVFVSAGEKVVMLDYEGAIIAETDAKEEVLHIALADIDEDTVPEIFYTINDGKYTIFVLDFKDGELKEAHEFDFTNYFGVSTKEKKEAAIAPVVFCDIDADGITEILAVVNSGYTLTPRGILAFEYPSGEVEWFYRSAASLSIDAFCDINDDGNPEIVVSSHSCCNGSVEGDRDDCHVYLIVLDLKGEEVWSKEIAGSLQVVRAAAEDLHGDGTMEIVGAVLDANNVYGRLFVMDGNGEMVHDTGEVGYSLWLGGIVDVDGDGFKEIVVTDSDGNVSIYSHELALLKTESITGYMLSEVEGINDIDGDGAKEIVVRVWDRSIRILDIDLQEVWRTSVESPYMLEGLVANVWGCGNDLFVLSENALDMYSFEGEKESLCVPFDTSLAPTELAESPLDTYRPLFIFVVVLGSFLSILFMRKRNISLFSYNTRRTRDLMILSLERRTEVTYQISLESVQGIIYPTKSTRVIDMPPAMRSDMIARIDCASKVINTFLSLGKKPTKTGEELKKMGTVIYKKFIPQDFAKELVHPYLVLEVEDVQIPWELMYADDFFALKYAVSRRIKSEKVCEILKKKKREKKALIIADPTETLAGAVTECEYLMEYLQGFFTITYLTPEKARKKDVMHHFSQQYDIIHYAGDLDTHTGLPVYKDVMTCKDIERTLEGSPIVFLNGCCSAKTFSYDIEGLAKVFLERGAFSFIGSLWGIHDRTAAQIAAEFYKTCLNYPVGEALRLSRKKYYSPTDITWAAFVMYGDPTLHLYR
jgi:hypothetical protein